MKDFFRGLLYEKNGNGASLGRVVLWILLLICINFWYTRPIDKFPNSLENAFMYVLAYNFLKKGIDVARVHVSKKTGEE